MHTRHLVQGAFALAIMLNAGSAFAQSAAGQGPGAATGNDSSALVVTHVPPNRYHDPEHVDRCRDAYPDYNPMNNIYSGEDGQLHYCEL